jgi:hypothetical protein
MSDAEPLTTRTRPELCIRCGYLYDAASALKPEHEARAPSEGDISVCINCAHAMVFRADLSKRPLTEQERLKLPREIRQHLRMAKRACMLAHGINLATRGGRT